MRRTDIMNEILRDRNMTRWPADPLFFTTVPVQAPACTISCSVTARAVSFLTNTPKVQRGKLPRTPLVGSFFESTYGHYGYVERRPLSTLHLRRIVLPFTGNEHEKAEPYTIAGFGSARSPARRPFVSHVCHISLVCSAWLGSA